jgi:hypothetical protein
MMKRLLLVIVAGDATYEIQLAKSTLLMQLLN